MTITEHIVDEVLSRHPDTFPAVPQPAMFYRNVNFMSRNYECTNVVACELIYERAVVPDGYEPTDKAIIANLTPLWIENGIRFYGHI